MFSQDEKLLEINDIIEMKITHRRNIKKIEDKFGYKSNSTIGFDLAETAATIMAPEEEDELII